MGVLSCWNKSTDNGVKFSKVNVDLAEFGHKHSASDVYSNQIRAYLSVYRIYGHRSSDSTTNSSVYIGHYSY